MAAEGLAASAPEPRRFVRDVLLCDGSTLRLQAPTPVEFEDIKAFYDGLSPGSRYLRFHGSEDKQDQPAPRRTVSKVGPSFRIAGRADCTARA